MTSIFTINPSYLYTMVDESFIVLKALETIFALEIKFSSHLMSVLYVHCHIPFTTKRFPTDVTRVGFLNRKHRFKQM